MQQAGNRWWLTGEWEKAENGGAFVLGMFGYGVAGIWWRYTDDEKTVDKAGRITEDRRRFAGTREKAAMEADFFRVYEINKEEKGKESMTAGIRQCWDFELVDDVNDDITFSGMRCTDDISNNVIDHKMNWANEFKEAAEFVFKGTAEFLKFYWREGQNILSPRPIAIGKKKNSAHSL